MRNLPMLLVVACALPLVSRATTTIYQHGDPSDYEQLVLELINRTRANPGAEAARYGIDLNQGLSAGTIQNTPKQPLAFHPNLINAARTHSQWMLDTDTFSHTGSGGSSAGDRMTAAGYAFTGTWTWAENISYGYAVDLTAHAYERHQSLFLSSAHRVGICNGQFEEIGLGLLPGVFETSNVGMLTEKFAASASTPSPHALGVVYYDFDEDGFYDVGEGVRGVRVDAAGSSYYANTSTSGGYALPVPGLAGAGAVSFGDGSSNVSVPVNFEATSNRKIDLRLAYSPPAITGTSTPAGGRVNFYALPSVPWATSIEVKLGRPSAASADGADDLSRVTASTTGTYSPSSSTLKHSGTKAYHLASATGLSDQTLTYSSVFFARAGASVSFWGRLRYASITQVARVQVSTDGGANWVNVFQLAGNGGDTESAFAARTVSLSAYAGRDLRLRFSYVHTGSTYFNQTNDSAGWFIDQISFSNMDTLTETVSSHANGGTFSFTPEIGQSYILTAVPRHHERSWPPGPPKEVSGSAPSGYLLWADSAEDAAGMTRGSIGNHPSGDINRDGVPNFVTYALGFDPLADSSHLLPRLYADEEAVHFEYWRDTAKTDAAVTPAVSTDLAAWESPDSSAIAPALADNHLRFEGTVERRRLTVNRTLAPRVFIRLRASQQ